MCSNGSSFPWVTGVGDQVARKQAGFEMLVLVLAELQTASLFWSPSEPASSPGWDCYHLPYSSFLPQAGLLCFIPGLGTRECIAHMGKFSLSLVPSLGVSKWHRHDLVLKSILLPSI